MQKFTVNTSTWNAVWLDTFNRRELAQDDVKRDIARINQATDNQEWSTDLTIALESDFLIGLAVKRGAYIAY